MTSHQRSSRTFNRRGLSSAVAVLLAAIASSASAATTGNLLTDPSFEANPLLADFTDILTPPFTTNAWGAETSTIVGSTDGITPADGANMLRMLSNPGITTEAWQLIDVSAFSPQIDSGLVTMDASAKYNLPSQIALGLSSLYVEFLDASHAQLDDKNQGSPILDNDVSTWQQILIASEPVPVGTRYLRTQVAFSNFWLVSGLGQHRPGYVDDVRLSLTTAIPEPATLLLAATAALGAVAFQRRRRK